MAYLKQLTSNKFIFSSGIVLVGSTLANVVNYLYNLILGRLLSPSDYGEVAAYVTLAMIIVVPSGTLAVLVTKYVSHHFAQGQMDKVNVVYKKAVRMGLIVGLILLVIFLALSPFISDYLKTSLLPTLVFALILPVSLIASSTKGTLQGLHEFPVLSTTNVIEALGKLLFAVLFVYIGWGVSGAIGGILAGSLTAYLFSVISLRRKIPRPITSANQSPEPAVTESSLSPFKNIPSFVYIIFFSTLFLSVFGNIDVVLAKHYLSEYDAGQYAALAVLGRIITYGSIAIITVLLPMAAAAKASNDLKKSKKLLGASLGFTILVSAIILLFFIFLPGLTVRLLFGSEYLEAAKYLSLFGAIMLLGSLSKIFINYFIATHEQNFIYPFGVISVAQIILIFYHHESISQIINILLWTNISLLLCMVVVYLTSHHQTVVDEPPIENLNNV